VSAGGDAPLNYQWRFNGSPVGTSVSSFALAAVAVSDAGNYDVVIANAYGSATSTVAKLSVLVPPSITSQPTNQTVVVGGNARFQVTGSGTLPLSFQWWFNGTNAVGVNTNTLNVTNAQTSQAGGYTVVITNSAGSVTSSVATLTVGTPPSITQSPSDLTVVQGQSATFTVTAGGDAPLNYQWRFNGSPVGTSGSSFALAAVVVANAGNYDVVVTNTYGSATSAVAKLSVLVPPSITSQPTNQTVVAGGNVNFQVAASGTSPLNYQWWFNATNEVGADTNVLTVTNAQTSQAGGYSVVITNSAGAVTSVIATLTVGTPPSITQQPADLTVVQGQNATFTLSAAGDAPLNFQWRLNGLPVSNSSSNYTVTGATPANAGSYDAVISNAYGSITSAVARLTVLVPPSINSQPTNQTAAQGGSAAFQVTASGSSLLSYQWWFNGTNAVGTDTNVLTLTGLQPSQAGSYNVVITNAAGSITSALAQLTVLIPPSIINQPTNQTSPVSASVTFSVAVSGSSPLTYQWTFNGNAVPGATSSTFVLTNVQSSQAGMYAVNITNIAGSITSSPARLSILVSPTISDPSINGTTVSIPVSTQSGVNYLLEYKNALTDPSWTPISTWQPGTGNSLLLQDTNPPAASRFYRVLGQ
jgi:hypothetical protein